MHPAIPAPVLREVLLTATAPVTVLDQVFFQGGENGVHQWESGIVLARYLLQNKDLFQTRKVLEVGSGSGLVAIAATKYAGVVQFWASDCHPAVLRNIADNASRNDCRVAAVALDWSDSATYLADRFDFVIGSDLIYDGAPLESLCRTVGHHLSPQGSMLLLMPQKRHMTSAFVALMENSGFQHTATVLEAADLRAAASRPEVGYKDFPELKTHIYVLHTFHRS